MTIRLMPAYQREALLHLFGDIGPAAPSMVARVITEMSMDTETPLPFVLRRLLELEAEVDRLLIVVDRAERNNCGCLGWSRSARASY